MDVEHKQLVQLLPLLPLLAELGRTQHVTADGRGAGPAAVDGQPGDRAGQRHRRDGTAGPRRPRACG